MTIISKAMRRVSEVVQDAAELKAMDSLQENDLALGKQEISDLTHARRGARGQLVKMAQEFGVSEVDIDKERWRALEIVHACNHCTHAKTCFRYLSGDKKTGFDPESCPNAERYHDLAQ